MYTMEDFQRDAAEVIFGDMTPEERVKGISDEVLFKLARQRFSPEQLKRLLETD